MPVEVPFVGSAEFAEVALDHRHGMVLDVLGVAGFDVGDVIALDTAEKLLLQVGHPLVALESDTGAGRELAGRTLEFCV